MVKALQEKDKDGGYSETEAAFIIWQVLLAVRYCHRHGICHRDIKLENIVVEDYSLHVKLIDFGYACLFA